MFHYKCDNCAWNAAIDYVLRRYRLPDGRELPMWQRHIWCHGCNALSVGECLSPDPGFARWREDKVRRWHLSVQQQGKDADFAKQGLAHYAAEDEARLVWQELRTVPESCLKCRSTDIVMRPRDSDDLPHPVCGGTLRCTRSSMAVSSIAPALWHTYSVNGELIVQAGYPLWFTPKGPQRADNPGST